MGVVYRAWDRLDLRQVAVKVLRSDDREASSRFLREAEVLARMTHRNIVGHVAHGATADGDPYLVMDWLQGQDLSDRLRRGPLPLLEAINLCQKITQALEFAHNASVIHRDLKPGNVFLPIDEEGEPRLLDFGIARLQSGPSDATRTGTVIGTPAYMAPEQARGARNLDGRADLFSLGCVLYECLAGRPPFVGDTPVAVLLKVLLEEPPALGELRPGLPPSVVALTQQLLAKEAGDRPADATQVLSILDQLDLTDQTPATEVLPAKGLTRDERRIVSLLLAADPWPEEQPQALTGSTLDVTLNSQELLSLGAPASATNWPTVLLGAGADKATVRHFAGGMLDELQREFERLGARLHRLIDGTLLATLPQTGHAAEQAARMARGALLLHRALPQVGLVVATGYGVSRGESGGEGAVGEAIEAAARTLKALVQAGETGIAIDRGSMNLVGDRFDIAAGPQLPGQPPEFAWRLRSDQGQETRSSAQPGAAIPLVARQRELGILKAVFYGCREEGASTVLLLGPPGHGKSHLMAAFVQELAQLQPPPQVWHARAEAMEQDSPYSLLASLFLQACDVQPGLPPAERDSRLRQCLLALNLGEREGEIIDFAQLCLGLGGDPSQRVRAARQDPALHADVVSGGLQLWLSKAAVKTPLVLIVDDLQWSDYPTLTALGAAHRHLREAPILLLALARPEVLDRFENLRTDMRLLRLHLPPLLAHAARQLVHHVAGRELPAAQTERILAVADGAAFALTELARLAAAGGDGELPTTVLAMAQARMDALDPEARLALRAASVFGSRFWTAGLSALAGDLAAARLSHLVTQDIIAREPNSALPGQRQFVFRHAYLREAAYGSLTPADRTLGHRMAAQWLASVGETDSAILARHCEQGDQPEQAQAYYAEAAEQAMAACDQATAERHVLRGLALQATGEPRARLHLVHAELHMGQGRAYDSLRAALAALEGLRAGSISWYRAMAEAGRAQVRSAQLADVAATVDVLLAQTPDEQALEAAVFAAARLAVNVLFLDMVAAADRLIALAESLGAQLGDDLGRAALARLAGARSSRRALAGDLFGAAQDTRYALTIFEDLGDVRNAMAQWLDLGTLMMRMGQYARAQPEVAAATEEMRRLEITAGWAIGEMWLGVIACELGQTAAGLAHFADAEMALSQQSVAIPHCWLQVAWARALLAQGQVAAAEVHAQRGLEIAKHIPPAAPQAYGTLAQVQVAGGQAETALRTAEEGVAAWRNWSLQPGERGTIALLGLAEAHRALGHTALAQQAARQGLALVDQIAGYFPDQAARHVFRTQVAEHRRLQALAERG